MRKTKPFYGPKQATWEVFLDGHHVTITSHRDLAFKQAREAVIEGRKARVVRWESCPHPGCRDGQVHKRKRGAMFDTVTTCPQCAGCRGEDEIFGDGAFYVSVIDGDRYSFVAGPYGTHEEALAKVDTARKAGEVRDPKAWFYAWGTCYSKVVVPSVLGVL